MSLYEKVVGFHIDFPIFSFTTVSDAMELFTAQVTIRHFVTTVMVLIRRLCFSILKYPRIMSFFSDFWILPVVVNIKFSTLFQRLFKHLHVTNKWSSVSGSNLHNLRFDLLLLLQGETMLVRNVSYFFYSCAISNQPDYC